MRVAAGGIARFLGLSGVPCATVFTEHVGRLNVVDRMENGEIRG